MNARTRDRAVPTSQATRARFACSVALALILGCRGSAPAGTVSPRPSGPAAPSSAPPSLSIAPYGLDVDGLPAASREGDFVVVATSEGDGGRGFPSLTLEARDRNDRLLARRVVFHPAEYRELWPEDRDPTAAIEARVKSANALLAAWHAEHDLAALVPLAREEGDEPPAVRRVYGLGIEISWLDETVRVARSDDRVALAARAASAWQPSPVQRCPGCPVCVNPAYLRGGWKAHGRDLALVEVGFRGTDTCWEPGDRVHVVAW
jgi:hypothetical protein